MKMQTAVTTKSPICDIWGICVLMLLRAVKVQLSSVQLTAAGAGGAAEAEAASAYVVDCSGAALALVAVFGPNQ